MQTEFVKLKFDIFCDWRDVPPVYRIFVNNELFVERTFIWRDEYLSEMLQISAPPGQYTIQLRALHKKTGKIRIRNRLVDYGPARWIDDETVEITHAST
jgi:hypothetical protein